MGTWVVKAGELSPHALHNRWLVPLQGFAGKPSVRRHLGLHEVELVTAKERLESVRIAPDLGGHEDEVTAALRDAAERTDSSW